jgi:hypothetical protein|tara:strand:+ start:438 stop:638 length:201 start_codon:yes stop_codon:yes gene_type:complete
MKAKELLKLLKPINDETELMTFAENPDGLEFDDEPALPIYNAEYDEKRNIIFLECKTTISRNLEDT